VAAYSFLTDGERDYDTIYEGKWRTDHTPYAAVHRVTVAQHLRGRGASTQMMEQIFAEARAGGFASVRIDTHEGNIPMRRMLEKNGFVYCGIVYLHGGPDDGAKRVGYERLLQEDGE
jgi:GNAT superfamily N-acetyltransferase